MTAPIKVMGFTEELTLLHPTPSDYSAPPQHTPPGKAVARLGFPKTEAIPRTKMTFFSSRGTRTSPLPGLHCGAIQQGTAGFWVPAVGLSRSLAAQPGSARCARGTSPGERRWSLRSELPLYLLSALGVNRS